MSQREERGGRCSDAQRDERETNAAKERQLLGRGGFLSLFGFPLVLLSAIQTSAPLPSTLARTRTKAEAAIASSSALVWDGSASSGCSNLCLIV